MDKLYRFSKYCLTKNYKIIYTRTGSFQLHKELLNFTSKRFFSDTTYRCSKMQNKTILYNKRISLLNCMIPKWIFKTIILSKMRYYCSPSIYWLFSIPIGVSMFSNKDTKQQEDEVTEMIKLSVLAIQKEELPKAEKLLHVALKSAQEMNNVNAVTYIFDLMANLALQRNDLKKAENLFKDVLQRFLNRGLPIDDNAVVEVSLKLSGVYANLGQYEKANEGFCFCIETQDRKLKNAGDGNVDEATLVLWAMCQDWYARFLLSVGKYENAKTHFLQAYNVCNKVMGPESSQIAVLFNDLGSVSSLLKNYDEAIDYLQKAIEVGKKTDSEDLCSFYINLGTVYMQKGLSKEAEKYCSTGLKIAEKIKNTDAINEGASCIDFVKGLQTV